MARYTYDDFRKNAQNSGLLGEFSTADLQMAQKDPDFGMSILKYKQDYHDATTDEGRALANLNAENLRKSWGSYSGGQDGGSFAMDPMSPRHFQYADAPSYAGSAYDDDIAELWAAQRDYGDFTYDPYESRYDSTIQDLIADILDYLGVEKVYSDSSYADVVVPQTVGLSQADAIKLLQSKGLGYRVVGDGAAVTDQLPAQGVSIPGKSEVVLYLGAEKPTGQVAVPDLTRMTAETAEQALEDLGLYLRPIGVTDYSDTTIATEQSIAAGTLVDPGTVVEVHFMDTAVQDYAANGNISDIH